METENKSFGTPGAFKPPKECHSGPIPVFQAPNTEAALYLGGFSRDGYRDGLAVIDLTGSKAPVKVQGRNERGKQAFAATILAAENEQPPYLSLPVEDYQPAVYGKAVLRALAVNILDLLKSGQDVEILCVGGHGRTGMVGTVVLWHLFDLTGQKPASVMTPDPITWLRSVYCTHIVQTNAQIDYVYEMLGLEDVPIKDRPKPYKHSTPATNVVQVPPPPPPIIVMGAADASSTDEALTPSVTVTCPACQKAWQCTLDTHIPDNLICDGCYQSGWRLDGNKLILITKKQ